MLILSLVIGIGLGLLAGGSILNLGTVRLRVMSFLFLGLALRYMTQFAIESGNELADAFRLPLFAGGFTLLLLGLWANREQPGLPLAFVGILFNAVAVVTNGGCMPVWQPAIVAAGLPIDGDVSAFDKVVSATSACAVPGDFLAVAGALGDVLPIPIPFIRNVASIGDFLLAAGLAFFLFAITVRHPAEYEEANTGAIRRRLGQLTGDASGVTAAAGTGAAEVAWPAAGAFERFDGGLVSATVLERPLSLGGSSIGSEGVVRAPRWRALPGIPPIVAWARRHPFVRLALDSSFSALWTGQLISAMGDRIHQLALAAVVLEATRSPAAVGLVFLFASLPNLIFGPIAGGLVDRWDHREVMIVSDLLRAGIVLLIPIAVVTNLWLAYPLVFLVTTVSIFFRPAKGAILPRIVPEDDLVPANSALWIGETFADIVGYVIAGLFVALLGTQLPLAFWVDSVTYIASALLIGSIAVAPMTRSVVEQVATGLRGALRTFGGELRDGYRFLRGDTVLFANTLQATAAQLMLGVFLALTPVYAEAAFDSTPGGWRQAYAFIEGGIGLGNLIGGFLIGLIGSRLALGRMVILGYVVTGGLVALLPLTGNLPLALGIAFGTGVGNLAFVIPSQTLFQRRTPPEMMGRVLGLRFSVVFGAMTLAMGLGGILGQAFGAAPVIVAFGLITVAAGLAGIFVPAVRDA